jgi:hypothetical protein
MLPPAPTAAELGKYGLLPVGLVNGTARADIPLYTFTTRNLSIPLSLTYSANGLKVDEVASWVGLGWSLNAGGVVTKIVRDEPDQANPAAYPKQFGQLSIEGIQYLQDADPVNSFDSEQDLYSFNFQGHTGKFMYSREGDLVIMPYQKIIIEQLVEGSTTAGYFRITTPDGIKYTFDATESTKTTSEGTGCGRTFDARRVNSWFLTTIEHPSGDTITLEYEEYIYQYPLSITQTVGRNISIEDVGCTNPSSTPCFNDFIQTCQTNSSVVGKRLKKISAAGYGSIEFNATNDRLDIAGDFRLNGLVIKDRSGMPVKKFVLGYTYSNSENFFNDWTTEALKHRMFLTTVQQRDANDVLVNSHQLEYNNMNELPPRLSYAQDHWGYFNGVDNTYLVPVDEMNREDANGRKIFEGIGGNRQPNGAFAQKGLLKSITWPTGGETKLQYESNTYYQDGGTTIVYPPPVPVFLGVRGSGLHTLNSASDTIDIPFTQEIKIETRANLENQDYPDDEIDPLHHFVAITITDLTQDLVVYDQHLPLGENAVKYLDVDINHSYKIDLSATGRIVYGSMTTSYIPSNVGEPVETDANVQTGGVRIVKTIDTSGGSGKSVTTNYSYAQIGSPTKSSGFSRALPVYYATDTQLTEITCSTGGGGAQLKIYCHNGIMHSSSVSTLYPADGGNVFYKYVTVTTGDSVINGATEHEFIINFDEPGHQVWGNDEILSVPHSNFGWNNGLEKTMKTFKGSSTGFVLLKQLDNEYKIDERVQTEVKNLVVRRKYEPAYTQNAVITCDEASRGVQYIARWCQAQHSHSILIGKKMNCIAPGADNVSQEIYGPCHTHAVGETIPISYALDHIDAMEYSNMAYWFYMFKSTETTYDDNGLNPISFVSEYDYDNPQHALLSKTRQTGSDGRVRETTTKYLDDYGDVSNLPSLREKFIIVLPIKSTTTVDGKLVQGDVITYNDFGLPVEIYKYEGAGLLTAPPHDPLVIIPSQEYASQAILSYDASGNLTDISSRKSPDIAYLWGNEGTKVVAKAVGAKSSSLFFQGFEETGTDLNAKTGEKSLSSGSYVISTTEFAPVSTTDLLMSYWYWDVDAWKFSGELPFNRNISAGTKLDEIRVYPRGSQLTTVSYDSHFDSVKSTTDQNNNSQYYEYDTAGRLRAVKDDSNNVKSAYKYHYFND